MGEKYDAGNAEWGYPNKDAFVQGPSHIDWLATAWQPLVSREKQVLPNQLRVVALAVTVKLTAKAQVMQAYRLEILEITGD